VGRFSGVVPQILQRATFVAACRLVAAEVARADDVAVGEEHLVLRTIELLGRLLLEVAVLVQAPEELLARGRVLGTEARARPDVEADAEAIEGVLDRVAPARDVLGVGHAFLLRVDRDRRAVLVAAADVEHLFALHAQRAHVDIGGQVRAGDVAEVDRAVAVGQGAGDEVAGHGDRAV